MMDECVEPMTRTVKMVSFAPASSSSRQIRGSLERNLRVLFHLYLLLLSKFLSDSAAAKTRDYKVPDDGNKLYMELVRRTKNVSIRKETAGGSECLRVEHCLINVPSHVVSCILHSHCGTSYGPLVPFPVAQMSSHALILEEIMKASVLWRRHSSGVEIRVMGQEQFNVEAKKELMLLISKLSHSSHANWLAQVNTNYKAQTRVKGSSHTGADQRPIN